MLKWLITVQGIDGSVLTYKVNDYLELNDWVSFTDRYGLKKKFHKSRCQLEQIND